MVENLIQNLQSIQKIVKKKTLTFEIMDLEIAIKSLVGEYA